MSRITKLGLTALALLVVAVVIHWAFGYTWSDIMHGYDETKVVGADQAGAAIQPLMELPAAQGPDDAPVTVSFLVKTGTPCPLPLKMMAEEIVKEFPDLVRVEYQDMADPSVKMAAAERKIACENAIEINGKNKFELPFKDRTRVVYFQGVPHAPIEAIETPGPHNPPGGPGPEGAPMDPSMMLTGFTREDVIAAIVQELKAKGIDPKNPPKKKAAPAPGGNAEAKAI